MVNITEDIKVWDEFYSDESTYFMQGGNEKNPNKMEALADKVVMKISRTGEGAAGYVNALLFFANTNITQSAGITVECISVPPTLGLNTHDFLRNEIITNPFLFSGCKVTATSPALFASHWIIQRKDITGKEIDYNLQPLNYASPDNANPSIVDIQDFVLAVDSNIGMYVPILKNSQLILTFHIYKRLDTTHHLFNRDELMINTNPRLTGNPIYDVKLIAEHDPCAALDKIIEESEYKSDELFSNQPRLSEDVVKAITPRLSGNPIEDIMLTEANK